MKKFYFIFFYLLPFIVKAQLPPESDPHRGVYLDRFVKEKLTGNAIDPNFSILSVDTNSDGIFEKEDTYLEYCCENHITYIAIYDLHKITGGSMTAWNENTKQYENLEVHLCRFMEKAKHQYGITQIGGVVGSVNAVWDLLTYMNKFPVAPNCTTCQADFDIVNIENEFWGNCMADLPAFIAIMNAMDSMTTIYNTAHPNNTMTTDAYLAFLNYCNAAPGPAATARIMDGCTSCSPFAGLTNPHPRKIDRVLYSILTSNPTTYTFNEINSFEDSLTYDSTDFHPMFYSEGMNTAGTYDFLGPWLANDPIHTIFVAEDYFYYWWRTFSNAAFGTPRLNDIQPGGAHWFAGSHMVGTLDHPMVVQVYHPYCTTDSSHIMFNYLGPDEMGTDYKFFVTRNSDNAIVYPTNGGIYAGVSVSTVPNPGTRTINFADTSKFAPCFLPVGEYTAHLQLAYNHSTGCTYKSDYKFIVDNKARLQLSGDTAFCHGHQTFLSTDSGATGYAWYRNGELITGANTKLLKVTEAGDYYCSLTGGTCPSVTDTMHITVHPLPVVEVNANCNGNGTVTLKSNLSPANSSSTAISGSGGVTYLWNTGATTDQITVNATATGSYRCIVTDPYSGCSVYRHLSVPNPLSIQYTAVVTVDHQPGGCAHDGQLTATLSPPQGQYDPVRYLWSNGETTATISNLAGSPPARTIRPWRTSRR